MANTSAKIEPDKFPSPTLQWSDIFKVIASIAGFVGVGGALLWFFGRSFYSGLLSALGVSSLTVSIAPEDYLEKGITSFEYFILDVLFTLFLYYLAYLFKVSYFEKILRHIKNYLARIALILLVFTIGVIVGILLTDTSNLGISVSYFYKDPINLLSIFMIFMGLETSFLFASPAGIKNQNKQPENQSIISPQTPIALARILILIAMLGNFLTIQSGTSLMNGYMTGCRAVLRKSTPAVIFSNNPILVEGQTRTQDLYTYKDYFLLFTDADNYFLFREINFSNYKPIDLFVVSKDVAKAIQITAIPISKSENDKYNDMCINKIKLAKPSGGTS